MPQVYANGHLTIEAFTGLGRFANNTYVLRPAGGGAATVVDVPEGVEAVVAALGETPVERIVVTHSHGDHWAGFDVMRAAVAEEPERHSTGPARRTSHAAGRRTDPEELPVTQRTEPFRRF